MWLVPLSSDLGRLVIIILFYCSDDTKRMQYENVTSRVMVFVRFSRQTLGFVIHMKICLFFTLYVSIPIDTYTISGQQSLTIVMSSFKLIMHPTILNGFYWNCFSILQNPTNVLDPTKHLPYQSAHFPTKAISPKNIAHDLICEIEISHRFSFHLDVTFT